MAQFCGGVVPAGVRGAHQPAAEQADERLAFPSDQFAAQLTRISDKHPIYVAEPSKVYEDWWQTYGEERFHEWLELQGNHS